jgi:hypothetical protein
MGLRHECDPDVLGGRRGLVYRLVDLEDQRGDLVVWAGFLGRVVPVQMACLDSMDCSLAWLVLVWYWI